MMTIFWSILILLAVVTKYSAIAMKIQVNHRLPLGERFSWWNRDAGKVVRKYRELYPDSRLPSIGQWTFWLFLAMLVGWAIASSL
jgi:hypothetical protein